MMTEHVMFYVSTSLNLRKKFSLLRIIANDRDCTDGHKNNEECSHSGKKTK